MNKWRKIIAVALSLVIAVSVDVGGIPESKAATDYGLSNPRVEMLTRDVIEFGSYWQEDTNGDGVADQKDAKTPVKWQILEQSDTDGDGEVDDLFLLADKVLDVKAYNETGVKKEDGDGNNYIDYSCTWETSTIRSWMNSEFYDALFTDEEKKAVKETEVTNQSNPYYETTSGNDTKDYLFLLSLSDSINSGYGFSNVNCWDQVRSAKTTAYAKENGTYSSDDGTAWWWLRSPGYNSDIASIVYSYGSLCYDDDGGARVDNSSGGVRPALHINVANAQVSSALENKMTEDVALSKTSWDTVEFGTFNGVKITWRVLSVNGDDAFLLADRILLMNAYNEEDESVTWENCDIRYWLKNTFISEAFSTEERNAIKAVTVKNEDNFYKTEGGNDTTDKVYLLSFSDIINKAYGFPTAYGCESGSRIAVPTDSRSGARWWLRSPGHDGSRAAFVSSNGDVSNYGDNVDYGDCGVRPALHLNLSSDVWTKGKIVTSEDMKEDISNSLSDENNDKKENESNSNNPIGTNTSTIDTSSISPNYLFTMDLASDDVVAVARKGDTASFTVDTSIKGNEGGVMPTEEEAKVLNATLKYVVGKNGKALYVDREDPFGAELKNIDLGNGSWSVSFWVKSASELDSFMPVFFTCNRYATVTSSTKWIVISESGPGWLNGYSSPMIWSHNAELDKADDDLCMPWYAYQNSEGTWVGDGDDENAIMLRKNKWVHITVTVDTNQTSEYGASGDKGYVKGPLTKTYVNGKLFGQGIVAPGTMSSKNRFFLGINLWDCPVKGYYDDVALWKRCLSESEAEFLYQAEASGVKWETTENSSSQVSNDNTSETEKTADTINKPSDTNDSKENVGANRKSNATKPTKVKSLKVTNKKKGKTVISFKKVSGAVGYQIQYAKNKKFTKGKKSKITKKTKYTIKKLKKKKTYYLRVRAYKLSGKIKVFGKWSTVKKLKIKK